MKNCRLNIVLSLHIGWRCSVHVCVCVCVLSQSNLFLTKTLRSLSNEKSIVTIEKARFQLGKQCACAIIITFASAKKDKELVFA